jgi:hypothetical protein
VNLDLAASPEVYEVTTYTHKYAAGYGSPEVDHTTPKVTKAVPSPDGMSARIYLDQVVEGHIHDFDLTRMTSQEGRPLLHKKAYYTVNEIPKE